VLTDLQPVNTIGKLRVLAGLLNSWTEVGVFQRDAVPIAARGIDNLAGRNGTVGVNPVAPPPTVGGGQVGDLLAVSVSLCGREVCHFEPRASVDSLAGDCINMGALKKPLWGDSSAQTGSGRLGCFRGAGSLCDHSTNRISAHEPSRHVGDYFLSLLWADRIRTHLRFFVVLMAEHHHRDHASAVPLVVDQLTSTLTKRLGFSISMASRIGEMQASQPRPLGAVGAGS
jgi:hypothetical protein